MANEANLVPMTSDQSREEAKRNGRKGGISSGITRRHRKALRDSMNMLLDMDVTDKRKLSKLKKIGIPDEDINNSLLVVLSVFQEATAGNMQAVDKLLKLVGEDTSQKEHDTSLMQALIDLHQGGTP